MRVFIFIFLFISSMVMANDLVNTDEHKVLSSEVTEESFSDEFSDEEVEVYDPLSGYNRAMTSFNDGVYTYVFNPVSKGYAYVVPETGRVGVSNFVDNLMFPVRFVNNLLQFKFKNSFEELERFVINSTFGVLGFMDPASEYFEIEAHKEDFGQTLGFYGIGAGPHVVLPFLGPSNARDMFGLVGDGYVSPLTDTSAMNYKLPENSSETILTTSGVMVNKNSLHLGEYENIKKDALDLYPFLRDVYEQKRANEIKE